MQSVYEIIYILEGFCPVHVDTYMCKLTVFYVFCAIFWQAVVLLLYSLKRFISTL